MKKDSKQRLFEVMSRLDSNFKPKLNESNLLVTGENEYFPITTPMGSNDDVLFTSIVNQGIDSHLEGFTKSNFDVSGNRRIFNFHNSEIPILLRRLEEIGTDEALQWKDDIENFTKNSGDGSSDLEEVKLGQDTLNEDSSKSPINKFVYFGYNYPSINFIDEVWSDNPNLAKHLKDKFMGYYKQYGSDAVMNRFYVELSSENQRQLEEWIINNYSG